jgi:hypothetical protein
LAAEKNFFTCRKNNTFAMMYLRRLEDLNFRDCVGRQGGKGRRMRPTAVEGGLFDKTGLSAYPGIGPEWTGITFRK